MARRPTSANVFAGRGLVWRFTGPQLRPVPALIQSVPAELYERLPSAGRGHAGSSSRHIIAPSIRPVVSLSVILAISGSLAVFESPLHHGPPATGTTTFDHPDRSSSPSSSTR
ncbi:hypothetical protein LT493_29895 [Streptomyces tricolor]|nr:hypothetical protein [Streptomyces tricolor]